LILEAKIFFHFSYISSSGTISGKSSKISLALDAFGLSRAILCNDMLAQLLKRLEANQELYAQLTRHSSEISRQHGQLAEAMNTMGNLYAEVATREKQHTTKSKFFEEVAKCHRAFFRETPPLLSKVRCFD
jgi:hypothetical protein